MTDWFLRFSDCLWMRNIEAAEDEAKFIKKAMRLRKGQRVLDAPCGNGRISLPLARSGLEMTGIDIRSKFIIRAKRSFRNEGVAGTFHAMDLRCLEFEEQFHGLVNWFGSFGYFSEAENQDVMMRMTRALRKGGRILLDQVNREFVLRNFAAERHFANPLGNDENNGLLKITNHWNTKTERVQSTWTYANNGKPVKSPLSVRLYTLAQLRKMLKREGMEIENVYGSWLGGEYSRHSKRLVVVARKQ